MSEIQIHNLTPRTVTIVDENGKLVASYPSEEAATADLTLQRLGTIDGVIVYRPKYRNIQHLPEWEAGKLYIVDEQVAEAAKDARTDLLLPYGKVSSAVYGEAYTSLLNVV